MIAHLPRAGRPTGVLILLALLFVGWWFQARDRDEREASPPLVQLPSVAPAPSAPPASRAAAPTPIDTAASLPDPRIAATFHDPGARFRNIRSADARHQVVCGEVRLSSAPYYRRFVWVSEVQMIATDDGGTQFATVAKLCDGSAKLTP